jgi:hypothetical protein
MLGPLRRKPKAVAEQVEERVQDQHLPIGEERRFDRQDRTALARWLAGQWAPARLLGHLIGNLPLRMCRHGARLV